MNFESIKTINDLKRDVLEEFIKTLPKEDKGNLRAFLEEHPQKNAAGIFTVVRAYIFNTYFRKTPIRDKKAATFASVLDNLLQDDDDDDAENSEEDI